MDEILVSIWCSTYNHELYIRDAIEGFLMQRTDFKYEIIIHDDASTDKTAEIVREFEQKYPQIIHGIYQRDNQRNQNFPNMEWIQLLRNKYCKGKYIAFCEGDDFWIDRQKLQFQVDYLVRHPECFMTIHDAIDLDCRNNKMRARNLKDHDCLISAGEVITQNHIQVPMASMVCRREITDMDGFFLCAGVGDYSYLLYCLTKGSIYYFNRIMSVYRLCHEGSWSLSMNINKETRMIQLIRTIDFLEKYNRYSEGKYYVYVISKIQICVDDIITSFYEYSSDDFSKICEKCDKQSNKRYHKIFEQIRRIWQQIFSDDYLDEKVYSFIDKHRRVFIMGAGRYAGILARQLNSNGIDFEGFVVSDNQQERAFYLGKKVWKFKEIQTDLNNIGIIIGINPVIWDQIKDSLKNMDVENYICPFLLYGNK